MEQKKCKNKKCGKILPADYKHKYCQNCMAKRVNRVKKGIGVIGALGLVLVTNGKIGGKKS